MTANNIDKNKDLLKSYINDSCLKLNKEREVIFGETKNFLVETSSDVLDSFVNFQHRQRRSSIGLSLASDELPRKSLGMAKLFYGVLLEDISSAQSIDPNNQVEICIEEMTRGLSNSPARDNDLIEYFKQSKFKKNPAQAPASSASGPYSDSRGNSSERT